MFFGCSKNCCIKFSGFKSWKLFGGFYKILQSWLLKKIYQQIEYLPTCLMFYLTLEPPFRPEMDRSFFGDHPIFKKIPHGRSIAGFLWRLKSPFLCLAILRVNTWPFLGPGEGVSEFTWSEINQRLEWWPPNLEIKMIKMSRLELPG